MRIWSETSPGGTTHMQQCLVMKNRNSLIVWNHPGLAWTESCSLGYDLRSSLQKENTDLNGWVMHQKETIRGY